MQTLENIHDGQHIDLDGVQYGPAEIDSDKWNNSGTGGESRRVQGVKSKANQMYVGGFQVKYYLREAGSFQALYLKSGKRNWHLARVISERTGEWLYSDI